MVSMMIADEKPQPQLLSKKAACNSHGQDSSYFLGWEEYEKNPYDPVANPGGIIQMGLAENQLSFDLLEAWLEANPDALGLRRGGASVFRELALFQDYHGMPAFKNVSVCWLLLVYSFIDSFPGKAATLWCKRPGIEQINKSN